MPKDRDDTLNHGRAGKEKDFSLEEILAEYAIVERKLAPPESLPLFLPPHSAPIPPNFDKKPTEPPRKPNNVVNFPGVGVVNEPPALGDKPPKPSKTPPTETVPDFSVKKNGSTGTKEPTPLFASKPNQTPQPPNPPEPPKAPKEPKESKEPKAPKEFKEPKEPKTPKESKESNAPKEPKALKGSLLGLLKKNPFSRYHSKRTAKDSTGREKVLPFPDEDNPVSFQLNRLKYRADEYAEHMFEQEGMEDNPDLRRAEKYIPGVDEELHRRRERKPRRQPPPAPDFPPQELAHRYSKGLKFLKLRATFALLLSFPMIYLTLSAYFKLPLGPLTLYPLQVYLLAALLAGVMLLGLDTWLRGLLNLLFLRMDMDSLMAISCIAALVDALTMLQLGGRDGQLPYCAASALALALAMRGNYLKQQGQRLTCRTAATASTPYLVTLDEGKWNGKDTYAKWSGDAIGFGRQVQADDGAQRVFHVATPLLALCCLLFSLISSLGQSRPQHLIWALSATFTAAASLSGALCFGLPWDKLSRRLAKSGAALAGWDGVSVTGSGILLTDFDLFPPGSVSLNGIKVFGEFSVEKVVGYAATLIRDTGSGLDRIFHDLLRTQGAIYRRATDFCCYEGGGVSAVIRDQQILVGSASFMHVMDVAMPQGLNVKNAVFCAIDGDLAGIFALNYSLHGAVEPALNALIRNGVNPVLATRDFNVIPAMLRQRFKLPVEKMDFPPVERRQELSSEQQEHSPILSAVLCREGLGPLAEAVVGGKRLRRAVLSSAVIASLGALVGVLLAFYLTFSGAYASLSSANLLVFLIMWLVPTPLIAGWVNRY